MRVLSVLFIVISLFCSPVQALTLVCNITNYSNSTYSKEFSEGWIPRHQTHVLDIKKEKALYEEFGFDGEVSFVSKNRIHWRYVEDVKAADGLTYYSVSFGYVFLRRSKRVITSIVLTYGLESLIDIKGKCVEKG